MLIIQPLFLLKKHKSRVLRSLLLKIMLAAALSMESASITSVNVSLATWECFANSTNQTMLKYPKL